MKMVFAPALALLLFALSACTGKPPGWVMGHDSRFPAESYLLGVGMDRDRNRAEDHARAEIAKTFEVRIDTRDRIMESEWHSRAGETVAGEYRQSVEADLTATTAKVLSGVEIREIWQNKETRDFYALALLDRRRSGMELRTRLNELDQELLSELRRAEGAPASVTRLAHYIRALEVLARRRGVAADLRVVDASGMVPEAPMGRSEIAARADQAAAGIRFGVDLQGDAGEIVRGAVIRALAGLGLKLAPPWEQNLTIRGSVTTEEYQAGDPWHWSVASAQVELVGKEERILDARRVSVREASQIPSRSLTLAREKLGVRLAELLVEGITGDKIQE